MNSRTFHYFKTKKQNIMNTPAATPAYHMTVKATNRKTGKFTYNIVDSEGKVVKTRNSDRMYVAASVHYNWFFGRLSLIGKGDMGKALKNHVGEPEVIAKINEVAYLDEEGIAMFNNL